MLSILLSWHAQYSYALGLTPHSNVMSLFHQLFVCKHWSREEFSLEASTFQQLFESLKGCIFNSENIQTSSKSLSQPQKSSVAWEIFFSPPHPQEKRKRTHSASSLWRFREIPEQGSKKQEGLMVAGIIPVVIPAGYCSCIWALPKFCVWSSGA